MKLAGCDFIDLYVNWLKENITTNEIGQHIEITTPFLDRHNDHIQIYVKQNDIGFTLTDDGYTISDLIMSGCDLTSDKRKSTLTTLTNGFGIKINNQELTANANVENFAPKKHALIQAILSVNDMFMQSQNKVMSLFLEDVQAYFDANDIRYISSVPFFGKSGLPHTFDFAIPASKKSPERLVRAINNLTKEKTESILFSWNDIQETRSQESKLFVFINDGDKAVKPDMKNAFLQYGISPVLWSDRGNVLEKLIA